MAEIDLSTANAIQQVNGLGNALGSVQSQMNGIGKDSQAAFGTAGANANILSGDMNNLSLSVTAVHTQLRDYLPKSVNTAVDGFQSLGNSIGNMFNGSGGNPLTMIEGSLANIGNLFASGGILQRGGLNAAASMLPFTNMLDKIGCEIEHMGDKAPPTIPCPKLECDDININVKTNAKDAAREASEALNSIPKSLPVDIPISLAPGIPGLIEQVLGLQNLIGKPMTIPISASGIEGIKTASDTLRAEISTTVTMPVVSTGTEAIKTTVNTIRTSIGTTASMPIVSTGTELIKTTVSTIRTSINTTATMPITSTGTELIRTTTTALRTSIQTLTAMPVVSTGTELIKTTVDTLKVNIVKPAQIPVVSTGTELVKTTVDTLKTFIKLPAPVVIKPDTASFAGAIMAGAVVKAVISTPAPVIMKPDVASIATVILAGETVKAVLATPVLVSVKANTQPMTAMLTTFAQVKSFIESQPIQINMGQQGDNYAARQSMMNAAYQMAGNLQQQSTQANFGQSSQGSSTWDASIGGSSWRGQSLPQLGSTGANIYSILGQTLAGAGIGAGTGALAGGVGAIPGAAIGGGASLLGALFGQRQEISNTLNGSGFNNDLGQAAGDTALSALFAGLGGAGGSVLGRAAGGLFGRGAGAVTGDVIESVGSGLAQSGGQGEASIIEGELVNLFGGSVRGGALSAAESGARQLPAGRAINIFNIQVSKDQVGAEIYEQLQQRAAVGGL